MKKNSFGEGQGELGFGAKNESGETESVEVKKEITEVRNPLNNWHEEKRGLNAYEFGEVVDLSTEGVERLKFCPIEPCKTKLWTGKGNLGADSLLLGRYTKVHTCKDGHSWGIDPQDRMQDLTAVVEALDLPKRKK